MQKKNLLDLNAVLADVADKKAGVKFIYFVSKNKRLIEAEIESLKEAAKPSQEYIDYETKRIALAKKHAKKKDGEFVIENRNYVLENEEAFNTELDTLREAYKEKIKEQQEREKQLESVLEEAVDIKLHKIKLSDLPDNILSSNQLTVLTALDILIDEE